MAAALAAIGFIDLVTGTDYGLSLFYIVPVAIVAWHCGRPHGLVFGAIAAVEWTASDIVQRSTENLPASLWNGFTRLVIFGGTAWVLATLHRDRARLRELLVLAEAAADTDPLTGLVNSRAFHARLREEAPRLARRGSSITLAYIDLDNFKRVNDQHGHAAGDAVLTRIAGALRSTVRAGDLPARVGGDEFAVALWDTGVEGGRVFASRFRAAVDAIARDYPQTGLGASVGLALLADDGDVGLALRAADAAMYQDKAARSAARAAAAD